MAKKTQLFFQKNKMWNIAFASSMGFLIGTVVICERIKQTCQNREDVADRLHPFVCTLIIYTFFGSCIGMTDYIMDLYIRDAM
jgi:hypothetical protein